MSFFRRLICALIMLLAVLGIACCVAVIAGIWMVRPYVTEKVQTISDRLDVGLMRATTASKDVQRALETARAEVARVSKTSADLGGGDEKNRLTTDVLRALIRERVGPKINELDGRLATFSDAAVVLSSLLQSAQELPIGQRLHIQPEKLERASVQMAQVSTAVQKLQDVVGDGNKVATEKEVAAAASQVDLVLQTCQGTLADWQSDLDSARTDLASIRVRILYWLLPAAIIVTIVCAWLALSQISLFAHACKWFRGSRAAQKLQNP